MGRKKTRRQQHGSAWHWKQTDCWYYTLPGSKQRVPLFDEDGRRLRGKDNKRAAQLALARARLAGEDGPPAEPGAEEEWLVARVCSEYLQYCEHGVANGTVSAGHRDGASWVLNDLCGYCGALPVARLKKGHIQTWIERHPRWKSPATHRSVLAIVLAAFNATERNFAVANPLKGLKKPASRPRLASFSREDEETLYQATDAPFRDFLFAAMHTGLRPFCELARLTAEDVEETGRGMLWRVYSSKTKKTRKIPVRPEVAELTRRLLATAPPGSGRPLFRNVRGGAWTKVNGVVRFLALRKQLGWDQDPVRRRYSCYTCRHTFAHRMLSGYWNGGAGCSVETLAELIGDTPKVAFDHYGKEWGQHYQEPLWAALGVPAPAPPGAAAESEAGGQGERADRKQRGRRRVPTGKG
jgi:integrase